MRPPEIAFVTKGAHALRDHNNSYDVQSLIERLTSDSTFNQQLDYRSARFVHVFGLGSHDREDFKQDAWLRVTTAMASYDPSIATEFTFARVVADLHYCERARAEHRRRANQPTFIQLPHEDLDELEDVAVGGSLDAFERAEIGDEIEVACEALPEGERRVIEALMIHSKAECARIFGIPRGTMSRIAKRINDKLAPEMGAVS